MERIWKQHRIIVIIIWICAFVFLWWGYNCGVEFLLDIEVYLKKEIYYYLVFLLDIEIYLW